MGGRRRLDETRDRLTRWRLRHGGPGIPVPAELWAEAVEVARTDGAEVTARALRLDRLRLEARMKTDTAIAAEVGGGFVELDASRLGLSPKTVIRFVGRDGDRMEVELGAAVLDVVALAETFWRHSRSR
jgi:hypothetical protein